MWDFSTEPEFEEQLAWMRQEGSAGYQRSPAKFLRVAASLSLTRTASLASRGFSPR